MYKFQDESEKPVHLKNVVDIILNSNIERINVPIVISSISSEIISSIHKLNALKNLTYFYHNVKNIIPSNEDRAKELNKYIIASKLLNLGRKYTENINMRGMVLQK